MSILRWSPIALLIGLAVTAVGVLPAQGETLLRWKFEEGQKNSLVITQEMQMKMVMQENPVLMTSTSTMEVDWEVMEIDEEGVATLTQTMERVQMKLQGPQGVMMEYDSESDEKPGGMAAMIVPMLEAMVGKSYSVRMSPQGNIVEMKLPQGLAERVAEVPGMAGMGDLFSEEGMKSMAEVATFPEKAVDPGDTWVRTATVGNPATGDMTMDSTFTYIGTEVVDGRELEKISMEMAMRIGEGGKAAVNISDQSSVGTIYFDNQLGRFVRSEGKMKMTMEMAMLGQEIKQEIENTTTAESTPQP
jgi:Family of unknown function (DUF6263)